MSGNPDKQKRKEKREKKIRFTLFSSKLPLTLHFMLSPLSFSLLIKKNQTHRHTQMNTYWTKRNNNWIFRRERKFLLVILFVKHSQWDWFNLENTKAHFLIIWIASSVRMFVYMRFFYVFQRSVFECCRNGYGHIHTNFYVYKHTHSRKGIKRKNVEANVYVKQKQLRLCDMLMCFVYKSGIYSTCHATVVHPTFLYINFIHKYI